MTRIRELRLVEDDLTRLPSVNALIEEGIWRAKSELAGEADRPLEDYLQEAELRQKREGQVREEAHAHLAALAGSLAPVLVEYGEIVRRAASCAWAHNRKRSLLGHWHSTGRVEEPGLYGLDYPAVFNYHFGRVEEERSLVPDTYLQGLRRGDLAFGMYTSVLLVTFHQGTIATLEIVRHRFYSGKMENYAGEDIGQESEMTRLPRSGFLAQLLTSDIDQVCFTGVGGAYVGIQVVVQHKDGRPRFAFVAGSSQRYASPVTVYRYDPLSDAFVFEWSGVGDLGVGSEELKARREALRIGASPCRKALEQALALIPTAPLGGPASREGA